MRRAFFAFLLAVLPCYVLAQKPTPGISDGVVRIGMLLDMASLYADLTGEAR